MKNSIKELFTGWKTVPNLLSFLRILMVPLFAYLFMKKSYVPAVAVLALSGLTDFFDGKIARKFNQISALGKILDPLADKLTQITIAVIFYITFSSSSDSLVKSFSFVFLIFIIKEAVMVIGSVIMLSIGLRPGAAELPGKVATFAFYLIMIAIILFGPDIGILKDTLFTLPSLVMVILISLSAVLCVISFFSYMPDVVRQLKEKKNAG